MGSRGPAPKPTVSQLIAGDPGHRVRSRLKKEIKPPSDAVEPPKFLKGPALKEWTRIMSVEGQMQAQGQSLITNIDTVALSIYCQTYADYLKYSKTLKKDGDLIEQRDDKTKKIISATVHPYVALKNKAALMLLRSSAEFGFTPSARTRIQITPTKKKSESKLSKFRGGA